jgi:CRISPR-associated protein Csx3
MLSFLQVATKNLFFEEIRDEERGEAYTMNFLPAILIGGPPHAGKSVFFYRITQLLRERGIDHYALRACPDGEGNWFHEGRSDLMSTLRIKLSGEWPVDFIQSISQALEYRSLPFLVDMGGSLRPSQECLLQRCTDAILLLREDLPDETSHWQSLIEKYNLLALAHVFSRPTGESFITAESPVLEGVITGLDRSAASAGAGAGPLFDALFDLIVERLTAYNAQERRGLYLQRAPTELTLDIQQELRVFTTTSTTWQPEMLRPLLDRLPADVPFSIYGIGPGWLYAALAAYGDPLPFFLFDPRLPFGWIPPARIVLSTDHVSPDDIHVETIVTQEAHILQIQFPHDRLEYFRPDPLPFPPLPTEAGLIIDGRVPNWLLTSLVRAYKTAGVAWIATFYPQLEKAVVVYSRVTSLQPGDLVTRPGT